MDKLIISNKQLKNIVNDDRQKNIIALATYETLLKIEEIKENINYEKQLIQDIQFLIVLKDELNTNILNFNFEELNYIIEKKCWQKYISYIDWTLDFWYFDFDLREKIINHYNLFIKHSNQKQKQQIINDNFNSNNKKREYQNWKQKYLKNINEKILKNSIEQGIEALEYFKNEINSSDFQNSQPSTSWYKPISPKI